eukprot:m.7462 g.7462  ORF g.7462 m.7462 type:complete len:259 (+) comp2810_c0_seq1:66-842(+)
MMRGLATVVLALAITATFVVAADPNCQIINEYGCYVDTLQPRTLPQKADNANSWTECAANCYNIGFTGTAGTENGEECWCSNNNGAVGAPSSNPSECNKPCPDDPSRNCGGESLLNEFSFQCQSSQKYYNCDQGLCVEDPNGPWTDPNCAGTCTGPSPPSPPPPSTSTEAPPSSSTEAPPSKSKKLSGGSILLIIFFCGLAIPYFLFGALFMKFQKNASGRELIPNVDFWVSIPSLVGDGFRITFNKIRGGGGRYSSL